MFRAEGTIVVNEANRAWWQSLVGFHHEFWFWHQCDAGTKTTTCYLYCTKLIDILLAELGDVEPIDAKTKAW